jgi:hypothetical protein
MVINKNERENRSLSYELTEDDDIFLDPAFPMKTEEDLDELEYKLGHDLDYRMRMVTTPDLNYLIVVK